MSDAEQVRRDFDLIARAIEAGGASDTLQPYERALLAHLPARCEQALEVGCGHGALTRELARRAGSVLALDLSPEMIRVAHARLASVPNVELRVADVTTTALPAASFDVVLCVAMLHHVPLAPTLAQLAATVRPGGVLVIQDVVTREGVRNLPVNALAWLARRWRRLRGQRSAHVPRAVAALYAAHGRGERYLTMPDARRTYAALLPGARVYAELEWRYTMVWRSVQSP